MKLLLPKQHGAWAMLLVPFLLGAAAGGFRFVHISLFLGWMFLYLATYPFLMYVKGKKKKLHMKWAGIYFSVALCFLAIVLVYDWTMLMFGGMMLPLFVINMIFAKNKKERAFTNDVTAIIAFCIGGLASYYLGSGTLDLTAFFITLLSFLFFLGSTFFVKTMIREKKNQMFRLYSWTYHLLLLIGVGVYAEPRLLVLAFLPSVIRAFFLYGKNISIMKVGILEIANSAFFMVIIWMSI
ncbi:hypothetical protein JOC78_002033 [Bacillus ectoiniformans]|uniref:YwiC-like family protein n=1 Tax=Bacillus ectoiniformans TaxID=1494429 RepID=UPI00195B6E83|nr:YwiC-like family protein [Bacillus ectoiniformans]MBM7649080.1 hypothetical protein [Bacillus ectoiniformans]